MDRNTGDSVLRIFTNGSLSARRAWIEIQRRRDHHAGAIVALRKESVDRNTNRHCCSVWRSVALRKESVDRNISSFGISNITFCVALRKESVDRNIWGGRGTGKTYGSLSARRAWREIWARHRAERRKSCRSPQGERG